MLHQLVIDKFECFITLPVSFYSFKDRDFRRSSIVGLQALIDDLTDKVYSVKQVTLKERMEEQIGDAR